MPGVSEAPRGGYPPARRGTVAVVGSANMDLVYRVTRIPMPGETVTAQSFRRFAGGKGLNQAVATQRAGANTHFIAAVGDDEYGRLLSDLLDQEGLNPRLIRQVPEPTGTAVVTIDADGENNIVVVPGANNTLRVLDESEAAIVGSADVLVCQLEVPNSAIQQAMEAAKRTSRIVVLNPAPVRDLPAAILKLVDVLVVNEYEAEQLHVAELSVPCVITTLGAAGATIRRPGTDLVHVSTRKTAAIDTTAAGDTFVGYLAAELASGGVDEVDAVRRACLAASLSVEKQGAVPSIPGKEEVDALIVGDALLGSTAV